MTAWLDNIASAAFVDVVIGLLIVETMLRVFFDKRSGRPDWYRVVAQNMAGAALLLAVRFALVGSAADLIVAALGLALLAHIAELIVDRRMSGRHMLPAR